MLMDTLASFRTYHPYLSYHVMNIIMDYPPPATRQAANAMQDFAEISVPTINSVS